MKFDLIGAVVLTTNPIMSDDDVNSLSYDICGIREWGLVGYVIYGFDTPIGSIYRLRLIRSTADNYEAVYGNYHHDELVMGLWTITIL